MATTEEKTSGTRLADLVDDASIDLDFSAASKDQAITRMVALLGASGALNDAVAFEDELRKREAEFTTGLGDGIAIPHAKSAAVNYPAIAFARSVEGVDWASPDGSRTTLIFLIAVPAAQSGEAHLRILALLARNIVHEGFRAGLLSAPEPSAVRDVLSELSLVF